MGIDEDKKKNFEERRNVMNFSKLFENHDEYIFIEEMTARKRNVERLIKEFNDISL